jgi:hypothetical protein
MELGSERVPAGDYKCRRLRNTVLLAPMRYWALAATQ